MNSDIALAKRAEDRVGDRMRERVRVGMTFGPSIRSDTHPTKHELTPLNKPVRIRSYSDP
jgi:hypothetical protein